MSSQEIKLSLIKSAIHTISEVGIDHATTKLLAQNAGVNEVYIYRIFGGKDGLFKEAFMYIDKDFAESVHNFLPLVYNSHLPMRQQFKGIFDEVWKYALLDKENCLFFIRYYYSRCYMPDMSSERKAVYADIMKKFEIVFVPGTDTWWLFNHILDVIFSSAIKILRKEIPETQESANQVFDLLYPAIEQYLK